MARLFNGTSGDGIADDAHVAVNSAGWTVAVWVKGAAQAAKGVYTEGNSGNSTPFVIIGSDSTSTSKMQFRVRANLSTQNATLVTTATVFDSTWHHFVARQTAANALATWVDGTADTSGSWGPGAQTLNRVTIAATRTSGAAGSFFSGSIAHVASWKRALATQEIALLAAGVLPPHLAPDHYWPLWGADSPEPDLVLSGVDATLAGSPTLTPGPPAARSLFGVAV